MKIIALGDFDTGSKQCQRKRGEEVFTLRTKESPAVIDITVSTCYGEQARSELGWFSGQEGPKIFCHCFVGKRMLVL
jgi:hypothetical protein